MFEKLKITVAANKLANTVARTIGMKTQVLSFNVPALRTLMSAVMATGSSDADQRYYQLAVNLLGLRARDVDYEEIKKRITKHPHLRVLDSIGVLPLLHRIIVEDEQSLAEGYLAKDVNSALTGFIEENIPSVMDDARSLLSMASWAASLNSKPAPLL